MAKRPVYLASTEKDIPGVIIKSIEFAWFPGMSKIQKQRSIDSLHGAAEKLSIAPILEISSKSKIDLGVNLSAFNLMITTKKGSRSFSVETAFQSSKVFERGGPFVDLLEKTSREAKTDIRLQESGNLVRFDFFSRTFDLKPRTFFYDWLYVNALHQNEQLAEEVGQYKAFTDIEFNPKKSINCQAYSAALFVALHETGMLSAALESPEKFLNVLQAEYKTQNQALKIQGTLL